MKKRRVETAQAPAAIGPYSQAIVAQGWVYCSGQIPLDPATGELLEGPVEVQTRRALDSLSAVLEASGSSLDLVVKTTVFLRDIQDFSAVNAVYAEYFTGVPPARSTVQVAALPRGARLEVEAVALVAENSPGRGAL